MKKELLTILLFTICISGCKKEPFEKKIRKVEITWTDNLKFKLSGYNFGDCEANGKTIYLKQGDNLSFQTSPCNVMNNTVTVKCAGKVLYNVTGKLQTVSVSIP